MKSLMTGIENSGNTSLKGLKELLEKVDDLIKKVQIGSRVIAPFGNRNSQGIVVNLLKENFSFNSN